MKDYGNDTLQYLVGARPIGVTTHNRLWQDERAKFALQLVHAWGTMAVVPDGIDKAGRQQFRPITPAELVARACEAAELTFQEMEKCGWTFTVPSLEELQEEAPSAPGFVKE